MAAREIAFTVPLSSYISLVGVATAHGYSVWEFCREAALEKMRELDAEEAAQ